MEGLASRWQSDCHRDASTSLTSPSAFKFMLPVMTQATENMERRNAGRNARGIHIARLIGSS